MWNMGPLQIVVYSERLLLRIEQKWKCSNKNGLYAEAPPEGNTVSRLQVYGSVGISLVEVYERVGKLSFRLVKSPKMANRRTTWL